MRTLPFWFFSCSIALVLAALLPTAVNYLHKRQPEPYRVTIEAPVSTMTHYRQPNDADQRRVAYMTACGGDPRRMRDVEYTSDSNAVTCPHCIVHLLAEGSGTVTPDELGRMVVIALAGRDGTPLHIGQRPVNGPDGHRGVRYDCGRWRVYVSETGGGRHRVRILRMRGLQALEVYFGEPFTDRSYTSVGRWLMDTRTEAMR